MINIQIGQAVNTAHGAGVYVGIEQFYNQGLSSSVAEVPATDWQGDCRIVVRLNEGHTWSCEGLYCLPLADYQKHN